VTHLALTGWGCYRDCGGSEKHQAKMLLDKTFKFYSWPPRENKTSTSTNSNNLRHEKETKSVQSSKDLGKKILVSERKRISGD
jgi:hypothetical protein